MKALYSPANRRNTILLIPLLTVFLFLLASVCSAAPYSENWSVSFQYIALSQKLPYPMFAGSTMQIEFFFDVSAVIKIISPDNEVTVLDIPQIKDQPISKVLALDKAGDYHIQETYTMTIDGPGLFKEFTGEDEWAFSYSGTGPAVFRIDQMNIDCYEVAVVPQGVIDIDFGSIVYTGTAVYIKVNMLKDIPAGSSVVDMVQFTAQWSKSSFMEVDNQPPETTEKVTGAKGENGWYTSDVTVELQATDALSGVKQIMYKIGATGWQAYSEPFPVTDETVYFYSEDNAGNAEPKHVLNVVVDKTKPETPNVTNDGYYVTDYGRLHASWTSADPESGIVEYQCAVGTEQGAADVLPWMSVGTMTDLTVTGLNLVSGRSYYFAVKAKNAAGLWSDVGISEPISDVSLVVRGIGSIDLVVTDPDGREISKDSSDIPSSTYVETDLDGDGRLDDQVVMCDPVMGDYSIRVLPASDAGPGDTYTLEASFAGNSVSLCSDDRVAEVPNEPYSLFFPQQRLEPGWNLISIPVNTANSAVAFVLESISGHYKSVWFFDAWHGVWRRYMADPADTFSDLGSIEPGKGYWVEITDPVVLTLNGTEVATKPVMLRRGWNLVGFNSLVSLPVGKALSSIDGKYDSVWFYDIKLGRWVKYTTGGQDFTDELKTLKPGQGYWVHAITECVWEVNQPVVMSPSSPADFHAALYQNYPNPFNPETWIPFELENDADVVIDIYTTTGRLVRSLKLGHRTSGEYTSMDRAAYWDGKTESGQYAASGVYFYCLRAGNYAAVRKMVVAR